MLTLFLIRILGLIAFKRGEKRMIFHKNCLHLWECESCGRKATQKNHPSLYFFTFELCLDCYNEGDEI